MRKKIISILFIGIFLFSQMSFAEARGSAFSGGSFSSGRSFSSSKSFGGWSGSSSSKSFSKSFGGWSGSSGSKSSGKSFGGWFGSSRSSGSSDKSSGSSSRKVPDIFGWGGSKSSSGSASTKSSTGASASAKSSRTLKNTYMEEAYKKEASRRSYTTYKQSMNTKQKKTYESTMNKNYKVNNRMNFEEAMKTKNRRISMFDSLPVIINVNTGMFGGPIGYGSAFIGPWDLWFLMRASDLFWYHHWTELSQYRDHFNKDEFNHLEDRVEKLEQQGIARDPNYVEPGVDPDLQFSKEYQEKSLDRIYYTNKHPGSVDSFGGTVVAIIILAVGLIIILKAVSKPKHKKPIKSRIY